MRIKEVIPMFLFVSIIIVGIVYSYKIVTLTQGNHDTTVEQGNHDTTVTEVRNELCDVAIRKVMDIEIEEPMNVKTHKIAGADGEVVGHVIIVYKEFPFVINLEESK